VSARLGAWAAAVGMLGLWVWLAWSLAARDGLVSVAEVASAVVVVGVPYVVAAAALVWHVVRVARGADAAARLLAVATAGRRGRRGEWGTAMRAELASIADAGERRRFALGCTRTALRTGWGRVPWLVAAGSFAVFAALTFAASRLMLAGDRTGILAGVLGPGLVFLVVGLVAARAGSSFRAGLEAGAVSLLAALAGVLAVAVPEAVVWYRDAGVWFIDGDVPVQGIAGPGAAVRDALGGVTFCYLLFNAPWPVLGAMLGAWRPRSLLVRAGRLRRA
jgi:hypothetical protein